MDDEAGGDAGAIGARAGSVEADVVDLWAQGQVGKQADVDAAADAIGQLVGRAAVCYARAAQKGLCEWMVFGGVAESQTRAEEISVGVQGSATRGGVVPAKIANNADPVVEVIGDRAADTVLVEAAASQAKVRVAD